MYGRSAPVCARRVSVPRRFSVPAFGARTPLPRLSWRRGVKQHGSGGWSRPSHKYNLHTRYPLKLQSCRAARQIPQPNRPTTPPATNRQRMMAHLVAFRDFSQNSRTGSHIRSQTMPHYSRGVRSHTVRKRTGHPPLISVRCNPTSTRHTSGSRVRRLWNQYLSTYRSRQSPRTPFSQSPRRPRPRQPARKALRALRQHHHRQHRHQLGPLARARQSTTRTRSRPRSASRTSLARRTSKPSTRACSTTS